MRRARLIALPLALLSGALLAVGVVACGGEKKDKRKTRTKTVTVQESESPKSPTGELTPKQARRAAAGGELPPGASPEDLAPAQGAGGDIPSGAVPPSGGIPSGAIPSGGIPPGAIPPGAIPEGALSSGRGRGATGFDIPERVKVKVDSSRRVTRNFDVCRQNREVCDAVDNVQDAFR
jgi:hypothetical protein